MALSLRPYQAEGIDFLADKGRAALFDEMGVGKTMQALLAMRYLEPQGSILVVATGDSIGVWQDEAEKWLDEEPTVFAGIGADPLALVNPGGITITNYHRLATALPADKWDGVIFDESQALRNRNTRTLFKTVRSYFDKSRYGLHKIPLMATSGTPIVKAAGDVWPILHLIDKKRWNAYWPFVQKYSVFWTDQFGWHTEGVTNVRALWEELGEVSLRRLKADVQPWLPPKQRQRVPLEMTPKQAKAYRDLERDMYTELDDANGYLLAPTVLAVETRLRQLLVTPRLLGINDDGAAVAAFSEIAKSHDRPLVAFTPFPSAMSILEPIIAKASGRPVFRVRGGMGQEFRESVKAFKASARAGNAPVLLASVTMSKGWDVSEVTHEPYFMEYDWNMTTMQQAEDRVHRDGQTETVFPRYFVHRNTHDVDALEVLAGKKRLADVILDRKTHRNRRAR